jgi:hypothetical protein
VGYIKTGFSMCISLRLLPAYAGFLHGLLLDHENGGDMFFRNVGLPPNVTVLQPRRLYSSKHIQLTMHMRKL